jgi:hypothetical protein
VAYVSRACSGRERLVAGLDVGLDALRGLIASRIE